MANTYLITLDANEAKRVSDTINDGQVLGIDSVISATSHSFDKLLEYLQSLHYFKSEKVAVISENRVVEMVE